MVQDLEIVGRPNRSLGGETYWDVAVNPKNGI